MTSGSSDNLQRQHMDPKCFNNYAIAPYTSLAEADFPSTIINLQLFRIYISH